MRIPGLVVLAVCGLMVAAAVAAAAPGPGMLLIARNELPDIRFRESVVLVVQNNAQGTAGLVLNRPSRLALAEAVPELPELSGGEELLSYGGPLAPRTFMALVKAVERPPEPSQKVFAAIYLTGAEQLASWLAGERAESPYRVFAGYAGWAPGQLDQELARGDWEVLPAEETVLFDREVADLWRKLSRKAVDDSPQ